MLLLLLLLREQHSALTALKPDIRPR